MRYNHTGSNRVPVCQTQSPDSRYHYRRRIAREGKAASELREAAVVFIYSGGVALCSCDVSTFTRATDLDNLFASFDVDWRCAIYSPNTFTVKDLHRVAFSVNVHTAFADVTQLTETYGQEALQVDRVAEHEAIYFPKLSRWCIES